MIYRVGDYENNTYDYSKLKTPQTSGSDEKFSLDHQGEDQVSSSKEDKEEKKTDQPGQKSIRLSGNGVTLEISHVQNNSDVDSSSAKQTSGTGSAGTFLETIQNAFQKILQTVKTVFDKIWNEPDAGQEAQGKALSAESAEEISGNSEEIPEEDKDARIQEYLHTGDLDQVINLLTDYGQKSVAKNSGLLTYYDKQGRLTEINPSDRERIMHGDRNVRKL